MHTFCVYFLPQVDISLTRLDTSQMRSEQEQYKRVEELGTFLVNNKERTELEHISIVAAALKFGSLPGKDKPQFHKLLNNFGRRLEWCSGLGSLFEKKVVWRDLGESYWKVV